MSQAGIECCLLKLCEISLFVKFLLGVLILEEMEC